MLIKLPRRHHKPEHIYFIKNFDPKRVVACFSDRHLDLSFKNSPSVIKRNRKKFLTQLGIDYRDLICPKQVHGSRVILVSSKDRGKGALSQKNTILNCDGLITKEKNLPIAIFTADCLSIFLFDPKQEAIGLVHAGWKSTRKKILKNAINSMKRYFGSTPNDILVTFGPAICGYCYEVGREFKKYFPFSVQERNGKLYFDLAENNLKQLLNSGIKKANIKKYNICTSCDNKNFFSYRREGPGAGRMISLLMLK